VVLDGEKFVMELISYFFVVLVAIFLLLRLLPYYRARQLRGRSAPDFGKLLTDKQKTSPHLLIYFWSPQCVMCKAMSKIIDELIETRDDIIKIDVMQNIEISTGFGIMGTPSLVLVNDGKIEQMMVGAKTKSQITGILNRMSVKK